MAPEADARALVFVLSLSLFSALSVLSLFSTFVSLKADVVEAAALLSRSTQP